MNTPTHIVSGIWLAQFLSSRWPVSYWWGRLTLSLACIAGGVVLHLGLDALPHYAWIVYLPGLDGVPFRWLIKEALITTVIATPCLYWTRKNWHFVIMAALGAIYPDVEKVAAVDFHVPEHFILFKRHSLQLSSHDGGLPHGLLIAVELGLIAASIAWTHILARQSHRGSRHKKS